MLRARFAQHVWRQRSRQVIATVGARDRVRERAEHLLRLVGRRDTQPDLPLLWLDHQVLADLTHAHVDEAVERLLCGGVLQDARERSAVRGGRLDNVGAPQGSQLFGECRVINLQRERVDQRGLGARLRQERHRLEHELLDDRQRRELDVPLKQKVEAPQTKYELPNFAFKAEASKTGDKMKSADMSLTRPISRSFRRM